MQFHDRRDAGKKLAKALSAYKAPETIVLALPRGGVPVAFEVAHALQLPLDLMLVRKLGTPGQEELAMGAIADGGMQVVNEDVIAMLGIPEWMVEKVVAREQAELKRRSEVYREGNAAPALKDRIVILVDDGVATGATMRAAVKAAKHQGARHVVVAVPVASASAMASLREKADAVVCLMMPEPFYGVGGFYHDFGQTSDEEVRLLLREAREWQPTAKGGHHARKRA